MEIGANVKSGRGKVNIFTGFTGLLISIQWVHWHPACLYFTDSTLYNVFALHCIAYFTLVCSIFYEGSFLERIIPPLVRHCTLWCTKNFTVKFTVGWFHVKTRRKKVNVKKSHFYEEIWKNIRYLYGFCHFWHQIGFLDRFVFFSL